MPESECEGGGDALWGASVAAAGVDEVVATSEAASAGGAPASACLACSKRFFFT